MHDRRAVLRAVAIAVAGAIAGSAVGRAGPSDGTGPTPTPWRVLTRLPGDGNQLALTFDDGTHTEVVAAFAQFCRDSGVRLTFFPNGVHSSWTDNAPILRPLVDSGQIQFGNHTWSHPHITSLPAEMVTEQIRRNGDFLRNTYGVDGTPYFRPPFGEHNPATDQIAADLGYTNVALWSADLGPDSGPGQTTEQLIGFASKAFQSRKIVLGHANEPTITKTYDQLLGMISTRGLQTVTLADVFG